MRNKLIYPYSDELLNYEFKQEHPLKPDRLKLTYLLSEQLGLLDKVKRIDATIASREQIEMYHQAEFIDAVISAGESGTPDYRHGLGTADNPIFPRMYDAASRYVGATLDAARELEKRASRAFVISGGLHHAHRSQASGFCIFNDVVLAIMYLQKKKPCKVLYVDIDAHHGDGVQNAFYNSKDVLTISMHQTGKTLFPGTGFIHEAGSGDGLGYSINIPVLPGASSTDLIEVLNEVIVPLFESYQPDLLVTQLGVDGHYLDPLAQLAYSSHGFEVVLKKLRNLASDICKIGWLAVGGGGYHPVNVARLWSLFLSIILDEKVPQKLPDEFIQIANDMGYTSFPEGMRDETEIVQQYYSREEVSLERERTVRRLKETIFPYHGL
ncbi:MAG: acetoin utilization protein AcuC [Candidatus Thorarchaeota archaeon]|nr:acetoin utilization protein AcuC [Candidatus Thorarchaeota archaeon]